MQTRGCHFLKKGTRWGAVTGLLPGDEGENIKEGNPLGSGYRAMKIF